MPPMAVPTRVSSRWRLLTWMHLCGTIVGTKLPLSAKSGHWAKRHELMPFFTSEAPNPMPYLYRKMGKNVYTPIGKAILFTALLGFLIADAVALFASCEATPPPSRGGAAVGLLWQLCAMATVAFCMQHFRSTYRPPRQAANRMKAAVMAAIFCFLSVMLFRQSILFSDTLSIRGKVSVGAACFR